MAGVIHTCPNCRHPIGGSIAFLSSGLGPSILRCGKCGHLIESGNVEWPNMGLFRKLRFFVVTLIYAGVFGLIYSLIGQEAFRNVAKAITRERPPRSTLAFIGAWVGVGLLVLIVQGIRVLRSKKRVREGTTEPATAGFFFPASNGFVLALLPFLALLIVVVAFR